MTLLVLQRLDQFHTLNILDSTGPVKHEFDAPTVEHYVELSKLTVLAEQQPVAFLPEMVSVQ